LEIQGKLSLWHVLQEVATSDARVRGIDFNQLIARAETHFAKVENEDCP
jgi:hypothetical protein